MRDTNPYNGNGYNKKINYYINSGDLLYNLEELRKDNMTIKFEEQLKTHKFCSFDYFKDEENINIYRILLKIKLIKFKK